MGNVENGEKYSDRVEKNIGCREKYDDCFCVKTVDGCIVFAETFEFKVDYAYYTLCNGRKSESDICFSPDYALP
jgi:hypothetical protein